MQTFLDKLREYLFHFITSALIIFIVWGFLRYRDETARLNNQLYLAGKAAGHLVVSVPSKKPLVDRILGRPVLHTPPAVPPDKISHVIEVATSSNCPPVSIVVLKDGTAVSDSTGVTSIVIENYEHFQPKLGFRLAYLVYPRTAAYPASWDLGVHIHYWKFLGIRPDLTLASSTLGAGVSYNPKIWIFSNTYLAAGYVFKFNQHRETVYSSLSVKF